MPDKEMTKEDFEVLKYRIEVLIEELAHAQKIYRGQTGRNFVPPLRLAPRKRRRSLASIEQCPHENVCLYICQDCGYYTLFDKGGHR